jgi:ABC-2 type transport system permease protein
MTDIPAERPPSRSDLPALLRCRVVQLRNVVDQQLRDAPLRTLAVLALLALIWVALYFLLSAIFRHLRTWDLVGIVADQHIFVHFFLVLAVMLAFSNAILTFGALYGRGEAAHLLSTPVHPRHVVCLKWFEGLVLSSWSFLLLGVPLMLAVARTTPVAWYYYPLFLAHFTAFVAIPACVGLLAAWAVAMWAPRRPMTIALCIGLILLASAVFWLWTVSRHALESSEWLQVIFKQISFVKQPLLPSTWTANGVAAAAEQRLGASLFYLLVVVGNAAFLSWLTINLLGRHWAEAFSRAQQGRFYPTIRNGWVTGLVCRVLFFYLPRRLRMVLLKDLRSFARDPKQWSQIVIMFGLLVIYVLNLRRLPLDLENPNMKTLIAFLNLTTVTLILATFTSRFVYPLLSLESQQLWLLELLPTRRVTLLLVKFLFALTVTGLSCCGVMALAVYVLRLPIPWVIVNMGVCAGICIGLCGLAIGLGARFPLLRQRNPARIASGFGGTFNLIASMMLVIGQMAAIGYVSLKELPINLATLGNRLMPQSWLIVGGLMGLSVAVAVLALWAGARHFNRLEC